MYSTKNVSGESSSQIFPVGVNDCMFKEATFAPARKDGEGDSVLSFNFIDDKGAEINFKAWEVIPEKAKGLSGKPHLSSKTLTLGDKTFNFVKGDIISDKDSIAMSFDSFNRTIKHVTNRLDPDMELSGNNYSEFSRNIVKATEKHKGKKMKIATEYKGQYVIIKKSIPFLADVTDTTTLEKLTLKLIKDNPTPTPESPIQGSNTDTDDWA